MKSMRNSSQLGQRIRSYIDLGRFNKCRMQAWVVKFCGCNSYDPKSCRGLNPFGQKGGNVKGPQLKVRAHSIGGTGSVSDGFTTPRTEYKPAVPLRLSRSLCPSWHFQGLRGNRGRQM